MSVLKNFLSGAPGGTGPTLAALACAECLTDKIAHDIYKKVPVPGLSAEQFLSLFKYSGLTEPRNGGEWSIDREFRDELVHSDLLSRDLKQSVHRHLLDLAENADLSDEAGKTIPEYLLLEVGHAYHLAGSGDLDAAMKHYNRAMSGTTGKDSPNGAQWLATKLREEQEQADVIPSGHCDQDRDSTHC